MKIWFPVIIVEKQQTCQLTLTAIALDARKTFAQTFLVLVSLNITEKKELVEGKV